MLIYRIPAALIIASAFFACLYFDGAAAQSWRLSLFTAAGTAMVLREFYRMVQAKGGRPMALFGTLMGVVLVFAHDRWCWEKWHGAERSTPDLMMTALAVSVLGCFVLQGLRRRPDGAIHNISATLMGLIYVWFLPGFLLKMRHLGFGGDAAWAWHGVELVGLTVAVAKVSDIGAYFTGRFLGKHKMSPVLSPKKTWEGAAGGLAASVGLALLARSLWTGGVLASMPAWTVALFGALMAVSSLCGDLVESALKRDSQVKDSGGSIPGFGGLLDVVDSLMVASPVAYFFFLLAGASPPGTGP